MCDDKPVLAAATPIANRVKISCQRLGGVRNSRLIKGAADQRCLSVAAASIVAKVGRDSAMAGLASSFPAFDFEGNVGYPSPSHQRALFGYGLTAIHRRSWSFVDALRWEDADR